MNGYLTQNGIEFLQLQSFGCILLVLGGDITRHARHTAFFVLGTL